MKQLTKTQLAVQEGRPLFINKVVKPEWGQLPIKDSRNTKLGKRVTKGKDKGQIIRTLTLPERSTCPDYCDHWGDCYGNHMRNALRYPWTVETASNVWAQLQGYETKGRLYKLRPHILGDFVNRAHVLFWINAVDTFRCLSLWGYTAHKPDSAIGHLVQRLNTRDRASFRFSGAYDLDSMSALSFDHPKAQALLRDKRAFVCPEQTGKAESCGACAACWEGEKPVVFMSH